MVAVATMAAPAVSGAVRVAPAVPSAPVRPVAVSAPAAKVTAIPGAPTPAAERTVAVTRTGEPGRALGGCSTVTVYGPA